VGSPQCRQERHPPAVPRQGRAVWTVAQLRSFLDHARPERFYPLWVLEATSGMRRCELAGASRDGLDLSAGTQHVPDYQDHGLLLCWEDGRPPHPDTITRRFKRLPERAGLPLIDLHDVRHSYATAGRDAKIGWKALSVRLGHADVAFTMKQYVQADLQADRPVAHALAELIVGGSLASVWWTRRTAAAHRTERDPAALVYKSVYKRHAKAPPVPGRGL
jgi:integrase